MSDFQEDEEMEEKIKQDPRNFDEDELQEIQIYKSRKLQAKRDAGDSGDMPDWWAGGNAPQTIDEMASTVTGEGGAEPEPSTEDEPEEEETAEAEEETAGEETEEETVQEEEEEDETTEEEPAEKTEPATAEEEEETAPEPEPQPQQEGVPQVGWSQGVPQTEDMEFSDEQIQGIYERQDELMQNLQSLNSNLDQIDVGGDAIDNIQNTLNDLVEKVDSLLEGQGNEELKQKVDEMHELLAATKEAESKLANLPPLPDEEELIEEGIIDSEIEQDDSDGCFKTVIDGRKAALHFGEHPDRLTVYHYNVPTILSEPVRHTIEDILARALFEYAREEGKVVHPQAARLRSGFLARHPDYYELTPESVQQKRLRMGA